MHYNFCRIHKSLRVTPAMAAGVTERLWLIEDIVDLLDAQDRPKKRGPYKPRQPVAPISNLDSTRRRSGRKWKNSGRGAF
jgi:hypothetical protein